MPDKLVITKGGVTEVDFTPGELAKRESDLLANEEQAQLDLLLPSQEEIDQAEFELKALNLLMEVGLI